MSAEKNSYPVLRVADRQSLIHLGSLDSFDITEGGKNAARLILSYLDGEGGEDALHRAVQIYEELIPNENFGGEYTALEWLCNYFLFSEGQREDLRRQPMIEGFLRVLTGDGCANMRTYLNYKYHFLEYGPGDQRELRAQMRFLEDFILFCNPARERWEATRDNLEKIPLKKGVRLADLGCGPGYYTFRFSHLVGEEGRVYAIETNPLHLSYLRDYVARNGIGNVEVVEGSFEGIGLPEGGQIDVLFMCSLYHNVYAAFTDDERDHFVGGIRDALREGGQLIIVDNDLVTEGELPYHGPYIHRDMLVSQLWYYGFTLKDAFQFTPQRYLLRFERTEVPEPPRMREVSEDGAIPVDSAASLVRYRIIGTSTSGYTIRGKRCGRTMYEGLSNSDRELLEEAYRAFEALYPQERVGDDYTALMWFIRYALAEPEGRAAMVSDPFVRYYATYFAEDDFKRLKTYLYYKFHLELPEPEGGNPATNYEYTGKDFPVTTLNQWNEFLIFNNPNRGLWEKTDEMFSLLDIPAGSCVADVGCGGGAFTWRFSRMVGPEGAVYATEINKEALSYLEAFLETGEGGNIRPIVAKMNDISLPENSVDLVFMCSMYHAVYITDIEFVKDAFIDSLRRCLRPGGRLVIVDNDITRRGVPSYYGPGIASPLVVAQLGYYGFDLVARHQLVPQRYMLVFQKNPDYTAPEKMESESLKHAKAKLEELL